MKTMYSKLPEPKDLLEENLREMEQEVKGMRILRYRMDTHMRQYDELGLKNHFDGKYYQDRVKQVAGLCNDINGLISDLRNYESSLIELHEYLKTCPTKEVNGKIVAIQRETKVSP